MKDYRKLKNNEQIKLEPIGDDVRVLQGKFDPDSGEKNFAEVLVTNEKHLTDLEADLIAALEREEKTREAVIADLKSKIAGAKALRADVRAMRREEKPETASGKTKIKKGK